MTTAEIPPAPVDVPVERVLGADDIPTLRGQIDAVDGAIIGLIAERARFSARVQQARISSGGARVELGREKEIMGRFEEGLGPDGTSLADAILQVCRGKLV